MRELILLLHFGLLLIALVVALRANSAVMWRSELVAYSLRLPQGLDVARVAAFFNGLSGLVGTRWRRTVEMRAVALELVATSDGIRHYMLVPEKQAQSVLAMLRAVLPGVTATPDKTWRPTTPTAAAGLGLSEQHRPLAIDRSAEISSSILAAVQPLRSGERIVVQWVLGPIGPVNVERPPQPAKRSTRRAGPGTSVR